MKIFTKIRSVFIVWILLAAIQSHAQNPPLKVIASADPDYSTTEDERPGVSTKDDEGNMYITGYGSSYGFVSKVTPAGNEIWRARFQGLSGYYQAFAIAVHEHEGTLNVVSSALGNSTDVDPGAGTVNVTSNHDIVVLRYNSNTGEYQSHSKLTNFVGTYPGFNYVQDVSFDEQGNTFFAGLFQNFSGYSWTVDFDPSDGVDQMSSPQAFVVKYNANNELEWLNRLPYIDVSGITLSAERVIITGGCYGERDMDPGPGIYNLSTSHDMYVAAYSTFDGSISWALATSNATHSPSSQASSSSIITDADGNIVLSGWMSNGNLDFNPSASTHALQVTTSANFIACYSAEGQFLRAKLITDSSGDQHAISHFMVKEDADGGYLIYGTPHANGVDMIPGNNYKIATGARGLLAKYTKEIEYLYSWSLDGDKNNSLSNIEVLSNGRYAIAGSYQSKINLDPREIMRLTSSRTWVDNQNNINSRTETFSAFYCSLTDAPAPSNAWPTHYQHGTQNIILSLTEVSGATSYTWSLPTGFTITSGENTHAITIDVDATAPATGGIYVYANNDCGASWPYYLTVSSGTKAPATIDLDDITKHYGDPAFLLEATSNSTGTISYSELSDPENVISLSNGTLKINRAGSAKLLINVTEDSNYGAGSKEVLITVNKRFIDVTGVDYTRNFGEAHPEFEITYGREAVPFGNSLRIDGFDDYAYVNNPTIYNNLSEITIEGWVKLPDYDGHKTMVSRMGQGLDGGFLVYLGSGTPDFGIVDAEGNYLTLSTPTPFPLNTWTHVACTYKAGEKMKIYLDGELRAVKDAMGILGDNNDHLSLMALGVFNDPAFFDEFRFWNTARSAEDIRLNMNHEISPETEGLIAYYNFNQGVAGGSNHGITQLLDAKGNHATMGGFNLNGINSNFVEGFTALNATQFKTGEDESVLDAKPTASTTATTESTPGQYEIVLTGGSDDNYDFDFDHGTLTINKVTATVTLSNLAATYTGSTLEPTATTTPEGLTVTFLYNGSDVKPMDAGTYEVTATIDDEFYEGEANEEFVIAKATQTITFEKPSDVLMSSNEFVLTASTTAGIPIEFVLSETENAILDGSTLSLIKPGKITISATQSGNNNYLSAEPVTHTICINPSQPLIENTGITAPEFVSSSEHGNAWYVNGTIIPDANDVSFIPTTSGIYTLIVEIDGCVSEASEPVTIQDQTISFGEIPTLIAGSSSIEMPILTETSQPVTLQTTDIEKVSLNGNMITPIQAGQVTLTASQAGTSVLLPSNTISITLCVNPQKPVINNVGTTFPYFVSPSETDNVWILDGQQIANTSGSTFRPTTGGEYQLKIVTEGCESEVSDAIVIHDQPISFGETPTLIAGSSAIELPILIESSQPVTLETTDIEKVSLNGNMITPIQAGQVTLTASQAGTSVLLPSNTISITLCINPQKPIINNVGITFPDFVSPAATGNVWILDGQQIANATGNTFRPNSGGEYQLKMVTEGCESEASDAITINEQHIEFETLSNVSISDDGVPLHVSSNSTLPIVITSTPSGRVMIDGMELFPLTAGPVGITVTQAGNATTLPAAPAQQAICINPITPTLTNTGVTAPILESSDANNTIWILNGSFLEGATSELIPIFGGVYQVKAVVDGCESTPSEGITIFSQALEFGNIPEIKVGDNDVVIEVTSNSTLPIAFSLSPATHGVMDGNLFTPSSAGNVTIHANQNGDATHIPAAEITKTMCITPAKPVIELKENGGGFYLQSSSATHNQWFFNEAILTGETNQVLEVEEAGTYSVLVTVDACESMSDEFVVLITGLPEVSRPGFIFPNPTRDRIAITPQHPGESIITIFNVHGVKISEMQTTSRIDIDVTGFASGVYTVVVKNANGITTEKFIKY